MTVWFDYGEGVEETVFPFDPEELSLKVLGQFAESESCPYECSVSVLLTDDEEIRKINADMRGIDKSTDVLSFPAVQYPSPAGYDCLDGMEAEAFDPDSGELMLGDVVISADHVRQQAEAYGHTEMREFAFLLVHSLLHLTGYDHMEEDERMLMEERQRDVLASLGIGRDGSPA